MTGSAKPTTFLLCHARAVTSYRQNFICDGGFFFTANLAERHLRLVVDDIASAKDDGFRCRSTHPTRYRSLSSVESVSAAITFNSRHLSTCRWTRALFRPRLQPRGGGLRRSLSSARAQICSTHIPRTA
jgi:hypothetical protein